MMPAEAIEQRVLVLTPTGRDAAVACTILGRSGVMTDACRNMEELYHALEEGVGAVLIAEEALRGPALARLIEILSRQPPWSDIPVVMLTSHQAAGRAEQRRVVELTHALKVYLLERPLKVVTLVTAVQAAL